MHTRMLLWSYQSAILKLHLWAVSLTLPISVVTSWKSPITSAYIVVLLTQLQTLPWSTRTVIHVHTVDNITAETVKAFETTNMLMHWLPTPRRNIHVRATVQFHSGESGDVNQLAQRQSRAWLTCTCTCSWIRLHACETAAVNQQNAATCCSCSQSALWRQQQSASVTSAPLLHVGVLCRQRDALLPVVGLLCELLCGVSNGQSHG